MLFRNQILTHVESSHNVRVLEVDTFNRCAWLFSLAQHNALPQAYALDCLEEALRKGTFIEFEATEPAVPRKYSQAAILRRNHAYAAIEPLIQNPAILNAATRGPLVRARAQELKCSEQTLYKYLRTWWHGGQSKQSLTPGFDRIGGTARGTQGRGRRPIYQPYDIYQVSDVDRQWMQEAIEKHYLRDKVCTVQTAYQRLIEKHYSYIDGEGRRCIKREGELPTVAQFRLFLTNTVPKEQRIRARQGDAE